MKKLFLYIFFTLIFCGSSFAEWKKYGDTLNGEYFIEKKSISKESGYIYFWKMVDYSVPISDSDYYSVKVYIQGDCKIKRIKTLSYVFYTGRKGRGEADQQEVANKNWKYPTPNTVDYSLLEKLC